MPRSVNPQTYPAHFIMLATAGDEKFPLVVEYGSRKIAEKTRFNWYYFIRALKSSGSEMLSMAQRLEATIQNLSNGRAQLKFDLRASGAPELTAVLLQQIGAGLQEYVDPAEARAMEEFERRMKVDGPNIVTKPKKTVDEVLMSLGYGQHTIAPQTAPISTSIPTMEEMQEQYAASLPDSDAIDKLNEAAKAPEDYNIIPPPKDSPT